MVGLSFERGPMAHDGFNGLPTTVFWHGIMRADQTLSTVVGSPFHIRRADMAQEAHYVHFGSVVMERGFCLSCGGECYITASGRSSCCHEAATKTQGNEHHYETPVPIGVKRRRPSAEAQAVILKVQDNKCYWCGRRFGNYIIKADRPAVELKPVWDHYLPFVLTGSCKDKDFVAACWRCNVHKSAFVMCKHSWTEDTIRSYLVKRWSNGGWEDA